MVLGRLDMVKVDIGEVKPEVHAQNTIPNAEDPGISGFPPAPVLTAVTTDFAEREPEVAEFLTKMTFDTDIMSGILAWMNENNANAEEGAVHFLTTMPDVWSDWINDEARENLSGLM